MKDPTTQKEGAISLHKESLIMEFTGAKIFYAFDALFLHSVSYFINVFFLKYTLTKPCAQL